jgi:hypothetical protein
MRSVSSAKQSGSSRTACTATYDCSLVDRDPCFCGARSASDVEAVATEWADAHPPTPPDGGCADCAADPVYELYAVCEDHRCEVLDVPTSLYSRCTRDADCIAVSTGCCPPCGPYWHHAGVNRRRANRLRTALCGEDWEMMGCPACAGPPEPTVTATCEAGHCRIVSPSPPPSEE